MRGNSPGRGGRHTAWTLAIAMAATFGPAHAASAQGGFLLQGLADLEFWKTDSASSLLARGSGHPAALIRGDVWAAIEPIANLVLFGEVFGEAGQARDEPGKEVYLRQSAIRFSPSDAFSIEAGKIQHIIGTFSARQLSNRNPLIGVPDGYATTYPRGARVYGSIDAFDYRIAALSLPLYRPGYIPAPSDAFRPAIGFGVTPTIGVRFGVSAMAGPYLNDGMSAVMPANKDWRDYKQTILAADAQISRAYFEGHAELAHSTYDIQSRTPIKGLLFYLEPKYTFTPRFFMALRYERNDYPFIRPVNPNFWVANRVVFQDVELGGGYRVAASSLLKLSARGDHWAPNGSPAAPHDNGYSVVLQWSQFLDFMELAADRAY